MTTLKPGGGAGSRYVTLNAYFLVLKTSLKQYKVIRMTYLTGRGKLVVLLFCISCIGLGIDDADIMLIHDSSNTRNTAMVLINAIIKVAKTAAFCRLYLALKDASAYREGRSTHRFRDRGHGVGSRVAYVGAARMVRQHPE